MIETDSRRLLPASRQRLRLARVVKRLRWQQEHPPGTQGSKERERRLRQIARDRS